MSWRGEIEDGSGHHGLAPLRGAAKRRNDEIEADIRKVKNLAEDMLVGGYKDHGLLLRRVAARLTELLA